ncbi:uncharacterized protein fip1l1a isoform 2-T2 [Spinachia spinachia]
MSAVNCSWSPVAIETLRPINLTDTNEPVPLICCIYSISSDVCSFKTTVSTFKCIHPSLNPKFCPKMTRKENYINRQEVLSAGGCQPEGDSRKRYSSVGRRSQIQSQRQDDGTPPARVGHHRRLRPGRGGEALEGPRCCDLGLLQLRLQRRQLEAVPEAREILRRLREPPLQRPGTRPSMHLAAGGADEERDVVVVVVVVVNVVVVVGRRSRRGAALQKTQPPAPPPPAARPAPGPPGGRLIAMGPEDEQDAEGRLEGPGHSRTRGMTPRCTCPRTRTDLLFFIRRLHSTSVPSLQSSLLHLFFNHHQTVLLHTTVDTPKAQRILQCTNAQVRHPCPRGARPLARSGTAPESDPEPTAGVRETRGTAPRHTGGSGRAAESAPGGDCDVLTAHGAREKAAVRRGGGGGAGTRTRSGASHRAGFCARRLREDELLGSHVSFEPHLWSHGVFVGHLEAWRSRHTWCPVVRPHDEPDDRMVTELSSMSPTAAAGGGTAPRTETVIDRKRLKGQGAPKGGG